MTEQKTTLRICIFKEYIDYFNTVDGILTITGLSRGEFAESRSGALYFKKKDGVRMNIPAHIIVYWEEILEDV